MDPEFVQTRNLLQGLEGKIWEFLLQQCPQSHEVPHWKLVDVVKRLEEGLFRSATTKEEYLNLATLEQRLHVLINHNQQLSNASPPIGTYHLDESQVSNPYHFYEMQNQFQLFSLEEHSGASLTGQDVAQPNNLSSVTGQSDTSQSAEGRSNNMTREKLFENQKRWLLFLRHARLCRAPEGKCHDSNCLTVQKLVKHMDICNDLFQCAYPRCRPTRILVNHHSRCRDESCPVCIPVRLFLTKYRITKSLQDLQLF